MSSLQARVFISTVYFFVKATVSTVISMWLCRIGLHAWEFVLKECAGYAWVKKCSRCGKRRSGCTFY